MDSIACGVPRKLSDTGFQPAPTRLFCETNSGLTSPLCADELKVMNRNELATAYHLPMDMRAEPNGSTLGPIRFLRNETDISGFRSLPLLKTCRLRSLATLEQRDQGSRAGEGAYPTRQNRSL